VGYGNHIKHHGEESVLAYRIIDIFTIWALLYVIAIEYLGDFSRLYELILALIIISFYVASEITGVYRIHRHITLKRTFIPNQLEDARLST
jgi:putative colanic acid biosynthesis UDP-glucose lipid carrier transferase